MQAYYEIEADITTNHQLHIQLPDIIPAGRAKVAVIYELDDTQKTPQKEKTLMDYLGAGKSYRRFSSVDEIDNFVVGNRETWLCKD